MVPNSFVSFVQKIFKPEEEMITFEEDCITQDETIGEVITVEEGIQFSSSDTNSSPLHNSLPSPVPSNVSSPQTYNHLSPMAIPVPPEHSFQYSHKAGPPKKVSNKGKAKDAHDSLGNTLNGLDAYLAKKGKVSPFAASVGQMAEAAADKMPFAAQVDLMQKFLEAVREVNSDIAAGKYQL